MNKKEIKYIFSLFTISLLLRLIFFAAANRFGFAAYQAPDTETYITKAHLILSGTIPNNLNGIGFIYYIYAVSVFFKENLYPALQILNFILSALTVVTFYFIGKEIKGRKCGLICGIICSLHINLIFWSGYILTETPYLLLLSISILFLIRSSTRKGFINIFLAMIFILVSCTFRSISILIIPIILSHLLSRYYPLLNKFFAAVLIILLLSVPYLITKNITVDANNPDFYRKTWLHAEIYRGLLWNENGRGTNGIDMVISDLPYKINKYKNNLPGYLHLMFRKLKTYWWIYHPEMSKKHKILNLMFFVPLYIFSICGLVRLRDKFDRTKLLPLMSMIYVFTYASMIGIVDYDLRYHLPVELIIIPIAACGILQIISPLENKYSSRSSG